MTESQGRLHDYIDSLREWKGAQDAKNEEVKRRLAQIELAVKNLDDRLDTLFTRIIGVVATLIGIGVTLSQIL